jgi:hypothetical protein
VKVIFDSNLYIYKVFDPPVELNLEDGSTLKNVLQSIGSMLGSTFESFQFLTQDGEIGRHIKGITLNGKDYLSLHQGLRTSLEEGDHVNVQILDFPLAGG